MTTQEKCEVIMREVVKRCNAREEKGESGWAFAFGPDWGGFSLTIYDPDLGHTHIGGIDEHSSFDQLVDELHSQLTGGPGLSWA